MRASKVRSLMEDFGELIAQHALGAAGALEELRSYTEGPTGFIREVIGEEPWDAQTRIAEAVRDRPLVTVRSCHAAGKDWLAARLALWWVYARRGLVVLTGPTATQVQEILMRGEVRDAFTRASLPGALHVNALRPGGEGRAGILAKTATGVSALTGFHDERVLFVITEAQDPEIDHAWDAAFAVATGAEDRILTLGNPVEKAGRFYRAHQSSDWHALKIAASDVPNVREGETVVPGLLTREGVERFRSEYGERSGFYVSRVLAEFPDEAEDALFRRSWLVEAAKRWAEHRASESEERSAAIPVAAIDPARHGPDASVMAIRRGDVVDELVVWEGRHDTTELAGAVAWQLSERGFRPGGSRSRRVRLIVDEVGLGGGVLDRLREDGWRARGFNGGRRAVEPGRYFNRRAESYWLLRDHLERGELGLIWNDKLVRELLAVRWRATPGGQVQLESKADLSSRIGRSPDRADAVAMVVYPWNRVGRSSAGSRKTTRMGVWSF